MEHTQQVHPHESESRTPVRTGSHAAHRVAAVPLSASIEGRDATCDESENVDFDLSPLPHAPGTGHVRQAQTAEPMTMPCHNQAGVIRDGLHLRSERCPREDYAIAPLLVGEAIFRHSGWKLQRQQTWDAMMRVDPLSMANYRFSNCGSGAWIQLSAAGDACRCVCNCCHHRLCVPCQRAVGRTMQENIRQHLGKRPARFCTLTLRHSATPLADQITRLFDCWSRLRRRPDMKPLFTGGVAILETTVSDRDGLWHVHLHILAEGAYVNVRDLSLAWHAITGDSSIVDLRAVADSAKAIGYVCKYISKPVDASLYANAARLDEYINAIHGRKTSATFGTWRGLKLKARPKDDTVWRNACSLLELSRRVKLRDPAALKLLALLRHEHEQAAIDESTPIPPPSP